MEKINFEDGQLVTAGYVQIEDVKYPITEAEYDGATPLSAFILNKMQENIEKAIGEVSSFDPVIVEELPTENIQEKTMYLVLSNADEEIKKYDAYIYKDNEWKQIGSAELDSSKLTVNLVENSYDLTLTEAVEGGGTITLPSMYKVGFDRLDVYLNGEKLIKAETSDDEGHYYEVGTEGTLSNTIQITSDWSAEVGDVFEFTIRTNGEGEGEILDPLPIGSILEYDGDTVPEGYEEVVEGEIYSTEEQVIGKWLGKPLYRKTFSGTYDDNFILLSNIATLVKAIGSAYIGNRWRIIPYYEIYNSKPYCATLTLKDGNVYTSFLEAEIPVSTSINITIEYTKTTDIGEV